MAPSWSPVILSTVAIPASTRPSRARSSSAGQGFSLVQQGEAPPIFAQWTSVPSHSEAEIDGQPPGVAVLGQVRQGLEGLLEGGHRLVERGAVVALAPACWQ